MEITERMLINKKVMFFITEGLTKAEYQKQLNVVYEISTKLGITWEWKDYDGFIYFKRML
tara:strand:+ start:2150 stop:2329 length:180 start_codon:yes stop_codon:yes gene_type:complete